MTRPRIDRLARSRLPRRVWEAMGRPVSWAAGGFVRDRLLGRPTTDLDLSLPGDADAAAEPAARLAAAFGTRPHLLGRAPDCVWRVQAGTLTVDLWPLGELTPEEDIRRRDFTCNALLWRLPDGPLLDRVGGLDDLAGRRLRAVARVNLEHDPVRLLRAARFLATLPGFALEARTAAWVRSLAEGLTAAPRERVGQELELLLAGRAARRGVAALLELGLLAPAAPRLAAPDAGWLAANLDAAHRLATPRAHPVAAAVGVGGDAARLALLLRAWGRPGPDEVAPYAWPRLRRLRAHRAATELERALALVDAPPADRRQVIWEVGEAFPALLALAAAVRPVAAGWARWWRLWRRRGKALCRPPRLLDGREVAELLDVEEGPELGRAVAALTRAQVRGAVRSAAGARRWLLTHYR